MISLLNDMTSPYSSFESWVYDRMIAPAVVGFTDTVGVDPTETLRPGGSLLDVGCGGGHLLEHLASQTTDEALTGVDLSPEQVGRASKRLARFGGRVRVVEGSALALPFEDGGFDVVVSVASIKHWPAPETGLHECVRVLVPGGRLVVIEADRGCHLVDAARFVDRWALPAAMQPVALAAFRTWVAGQSLDVEEARTLASGLSLSLSRVQRVTGTPAWVIDGVKKG